MKSMIKRIMKLLVIATTTVAIFACGKDNPFGTKMEENPESQNPKVRTTEQMVFLHAKTNSLKKIFQVQKFIEADEGGILAAGDFVAGYTGVRFTPGALPEDMTLSLYWDSENFQAEFGPHGVRFNFPVLMRLSYRDAVLDGVDENSLKIWYFNEDANVWELVGGQVNTDKKYVQCYINHFSRYGVAAE